MNIQAIADEMTYEWLENELWQYFTDAELSEFSEAEDDDEKGVVDAFFAEHKGWA